MAQPRPPRMHVSIWIAITVVLVASLVATLWVPFYNHLTPMLGGFPFFYWYQLIWVPIVAILSAVAYLLSKVARRDSEAARAQAADPGRGGGMT
jgi:Protein of unknown function (DUF3311)